MAEEKKNRRLLHWQETFRRAKDRYGSVLDAISAYESLYEGTHSILKNPNAKGNAKKKADIVRNIIYELIEAQVDSTVPQPKVTALREENVWKAQKCEDKIRCEMDRLPFEEDNDLAERFVYALGGCGYHVEWDNTKRTRSTVGEVCVSVLHPKQIIPQPGVTDVQKMDYIFLMIAQTKEVIKKKYGVDLDEAEEEYPEIRGKNPEESEDSVTQVICYYRNKKGGIGRISWANDTVLEDFEDYQARRKRVCKACGKVSFGAVCACGGKVFESLPDDAEVLSEDIAIHGEDGSVTVVPAGTRIAFYKPDMFPVVIRKNVSKYGSLLGASDIDAISDQQNGIKKLQTKIMEKLLKGGSFVTMGADTKAKFNGEELNVLRLTNAQEKALIDIYNMQPNIQSDVEYAEKLYEEAKQILGVTDSYLGRKDTTATSGRAKEIAVQQTSGRLESKRIMKGFAYSVLYELIIKFLIAFSDEPRPLVHKDLEGHDVFSVFSRYDFLEQDAAGEWFYNVDFLFSTDDSGALASNREAMWQETRTNFSQGVFGDIADPNTVILFWQFMESQHYPNAGRMKRILEERLGKEQAMQEMAVQNEELAAQNAEQGEQNAYLSEALVSRAQEDAQDADALAGELGAMG